MKTLATCKPTEFLRQTNKARKLAEKWLKDTDILNIRKSQPQLKSVPMGATSEERLAIVEENKQITADHIRQSWSKIFDAALDEYPEETLALLAVCCFIEPEDVDKHEVGEFLDSFAELISNPSVLNFFTSLAMLGQINTTPLSRVSD